MVEGQCCLSTKLFCMSFRKNNRYEVQVILYRLERSGQVWKSEKMSIWLKGKIMGQKWWEVRLDRQLYSDYIESQAKEFQHDFEWLEAIKYLGQLKVTIRSSLVRKITWRQLNQLPERGKYCMLCNIKDRNRFETAQTVELTGTEQALIAYIWASPVA